jgi:hypothetical protein
MESSDYGLISIKVVFLVKPHQNIWICPIHYYIFHIRTKEGEHYTL